jgi:hypothetical protein
MEYLIISLEIVGALALAVAAVVGVMFRRFEVVIGVAVLVGATLWHAQIVDRWGKTNVAAEEFAKQLDNVPMTIGNWVGENYEITDDVKRMAGAVGHVNRVYTNQTTSEQVKVWLVVGHARDTCRHTPVVCYPSHGMRQLDDEIHFSMPGNDDYEREFWTAVFKKEAGQHAGYRECVFWAWSVDPNWVAPSRPRVKFRNTKALYKLYFESSTISQNVADSPCVEFARQFLPVVNAALYPDQYLATTPADDEAETAVDELEIALPAEEAADTEADEFETMVPAVEEAGSEPDQLETSSPAVEEDEIAPAAADADTTAAP